LICQKIGHPFAKKLVVHQNFGLSFAKKLVIDLPKNWSLVRQKIGGE